MNRRLVLALVLCSTLALFAGSAPSRAADPAPVTTPVVDTNPGTPSPPPLPLDVVVCPAACIECGQPGIICCLPNHQCIVLWMPIWFGASGDVLQSSGVIAPLRACSASDPLRTGGP